MITNEIYNLTDFINAIKKINKNQYEIIDSALYNTNHHAQTYTEMNDYIEFISELKDNKIINIHRLTQY